MEQVVEENDEERRDCNLNAMMYSMMDCYNE